MITYNRKQEIKELIRLKYGSIQALARESGISYNRLQYLIKTDDDKLKEFLGDKKPENSLRCIVEQRFGSIKNLSKILGRNYQQVYNTVTRGDFSILENIKVENVISDGLRKQIKIKIKNEYKTVSAFCKEHEFSYSFINHLIHGFGRKIVNKEVERLLSILLLNKIS